MKQRLFLYSGLLLALLSVGGCGGGGGGGGYNGGGGSGNTTLVTLAIAPSTPTLAFGTTRQITASGYYSDGSTQDLTGVATWESSAPDIATVNATGLVTSVAVGQTTITATSAGVSGAVTVSVGGAIGLPQTGQVTSYAPGDDGAIKAGAAWPSPRFTVNDCGTSLDNTDDVVTDQLTGLMWVRDHGGSTTRTWQQSLDYANALSLCGFTDWRLANVNELESLVNAAENGFTWLAAQGFIMSQSSFWSSTTDALHPYRAWSVDVYGDIGEYSKTNPTVAWAVRGPVATGAVTLARTGQMTCYDAAGSVLSSCVGTGQDGEFQAGTAWPTSRFRMNDCGTPADTTDDVITDNLTGLTWLRQANRFGPRAWSDAVADADGLSLCGYTDWRLPNQRELHSLVNYEPSVAGSAWLALQGFENVQAANSAPCYWTSTSAPFDSTNRAACGFLFEGIFSVLEAKTATHYVLPVRGGL